MKVNMCAVSSQFKVSFFSAGEPPTNCNSFKQAKFVSKEVSSLQWLKRENSIRVLRHS